MHFRSRNHSPINEQTKERRRDHDKNKFSSENYPNQSCELDNHVSSRPSTNHPFSNRFYNPYMVSAANFDIQKRNRFNTFVSIIRC